jgi:predicted RNA-binding protein with PUA-like domain
VKRYWLIKSEASCYSIDDFKKDGKVPWTGVRNYQARNFMRDSMSAGDDVLFYHSSSEPNAIVGLAKVTSLAHADLSAQDKKDDHFDPKSTKENPIWMCVDMQFVKKFKNPITLAQIKFRPDLKDMVVAQKGSRLSVQPVSGGHFKRIIELANK